MNIALLKIGGRISPLRKKNINAGEADSILQLLAMEHNVFIFSKYNEKEEAQSSDNFKYINFLDPDFNLKKYNIDKVVVINGSPNFFGGAIDDSLVKNYQIIKESEDKVFYYLIDPLLYPKQISNNILRLSKDEELAESVDITNSKIHIITQCRNVEPIKKKLVKENLEAEFTYFPFDKYPLILNELSPRNENPIIDLMYGGTFRSGRREKDIVKFYFDYPEHIKVELFGKLPLEKFKEKLIDGLRVPKITGEVLFYFFVTKMEQSLATIVIGDSFYSECDNMSPRFWETILAQNVAFIDSGFDKKKSTLPEKLHKLYVKDRAEVLTKLEKIKSSPELRNNILDLQLEMIKDFSSTEYLHQLIEAMN